MSRYPQGKLSMDIFDRVPLPSPNLTVGEFLVRQTHICLDPVMPHWLQQRHYNTFTPTQKSEIIQSYGVGEVIESLNPQFPVGVQVVGITGWNEYVLGHSEMYIIDSSLPAEAVLSLFYFTGLTAYIGLIKLAQPKAGETLLIANAASTLGSLLGQLAKAKGLRVIGCSDSSKKCQYLVNELGFDSAIHMSNKHSATQLSLAAPDGIDIFFDNKDEPQQRLIYAQMNQSGRVIVLDKPFTQHPTSYHSANLEGIQHRYLSIRGTMLSPYLEFMHESNRVIAEYLAQGKMTYQAHLIEGFDHLPEALIHYFNEEAMGTLIVKF
ncbi:MDR family NADP-dependent oxidoreductase [Acinetobacter tibetensis]|nr:NADP-dependent oxidoreductase [Acinetobacter tibetensis]